MTFKDWLIKNHAPEEVIDLAGEKTLEQAWNECGKVEWLIWLLRETDNERVKENCKENLFVPWVSNNKKYHARIGRILNGFVRPLLQSKEYESLIETIVGYGEGLETVEELSSKMQACLKLPRKPADETPTDFSRSAVYCAASGWFDVSLACVFKVYALLGNDAEPILVQNIRENFPCPEIEELKREVSNE